MKKIKNKVKQFIGNVNRVYSIKEVTKKKNITRK